MQRILGRYAVLQALKWKENETKETFNAKILFVCMSESPWKREPLCWHLYRNWLLVLASWQRSARRLSKSCCNVAGQSSVAGEYIWSNAKLSKSSNCGSTTHADKMNKMQLYLSTQEKNEQCSRINSGACKSLPKHMGAYRNRMSKQNARSKNNLRSTFSNRNNCIIMQHIHSHTISAYTPLREGLFCYVNEKLQLVSNMRKIRTPSWVVAAQELQCRCNCEGRI